MIIIQKMKWGNWFSYGDNNSIDFNTEKVTQIIGVNGSGKSSIPVILGEVLCNKNALGKTKAQLSNRYIPEGTWAEVILTKDNDEYTIMYSRNVTLKLMLFKNSIDISSHSTTDTYATIRNIIGYDFKTFWGLVYQSSREGLDFLTATDTNRKKFLINLFTLNKYLEIHSQFKEIATAKNTEVKVLNGKLETIESWIEKNIKEDLVIKELIPIPDISKESIDQISDLKATLHTIKESNKRINDNEQFKTMLKNLDTSILLKEIVIEDNIEEVVNLCNTYLKQITENNKEIDILSKDLDKYTILVGKCPTCTQPINKEFQDNLVNKKLFEIANINQKNNIIKEYYNKASNSRERIANLLQLKAEQSKVNEELQNLLSKIDNTLPNEIVVESEVREAIDILIESTNTIQDTISKASADNLIIEAHNSRVRVIQEQLTEYKESVHALTNEVIDAEDIGIRINIIKRAFSTNGILSYKIEHLSKDLEDQINVYLAELSKGRFQLNFIIKGEKLNIEIIDDGKSIGIEELSAGELARVNTSTLLAIRKLMAAISSSKINILFLDEVLAVLDDEGKEILINILLSEENLNTFLVSHEYTNPLIPQISIVKENKISRIENE